MSFIGYTHSVYGQAGLEAAFDDYLRGLNGNPASLIWQDHLLYGTPPPGLDVRLSLSLVLQAKADQSLGAHVGAIILMNAETGEILVMASHPSYDPNRLDETGEALLRDKSSPLVNRAAQGLYPIGAAATPLIRAKFGEAQPSAAALNAYYRELGFYRAPTLNVPVAFSENVALKDLRVSPLQMVIAAAALSADGVMPAPRVALAVNTPEQGWVTLPAENLPLRALSTKTAKETALAFIAEGKPYWMSVAQASAKNKSVAWVVAGALPNWGGAPLALVVVLEENNISLAKRIGAGVLDAATHQ